LISNIYKFLVLKIIGVFKIVIEVFYQGLWGMHLILRTDHISI